MLLFGGSCQHKSTVRPHLFTGSASEHLWMLEPEPYSTSEHLTNAMGSHFWFVWTTSSHVQPDLRTFQMWPEVAAWTGSGFWSHLGGLLIRLKGWCNFQVSYCGTAILACCGFQHPWISVSTGIMKLILCRHLCIFWSIIWNGNSLLKNSLNSLVTLF